MFALLKNYIYFSFVVLLDENNSILELSILSLLELAVYLVKVSFLVVDWIHDHIKGRGLIVDVFNV